MSIVEVEVELVMDQGALAKEARGWEAMHKHYEEHIANLEEKLQGQWRRSKSPIESTMVVELQREIANLTHKLRHLQ